MKVDVLHCGQVRNRFDELVKAGLSL